MSSRASAALAYDQETFQLTLAEGDGSTRKLIGHQVVALRREPWRGLEDRADGELYR